MHTGQGEGPDIWPWHQTAHFKTRCVAVPPSAARAYSGRPGALYDRQTFIKTMEFSVGIVSARDAQNSIGQPHPHPSDTRLRSFSPEAGCASLEVFVDCGRRASAVIRVHIASKADFEVKTRRKVRISRKD